MKILLVGDVHWSQYSSIVRSRGSKYSTRLENLINTINWCENVGSSEDINLIVYLGDFFDKAELNAEEITALKEIRWANKQHYFIVGNHELGLNNLDYSSAHLFDSIPQSKVWDKPLVENIGTDTQILYLPYQLESNRKPLEEYIEDKSNKRRIILSHNDIAGIQMGAFLSQDGFSIKEIEDNCDLFINGHLHNGAQITEKIYNIGNITGQNFSEDAGWYGHNVMILDLDTLEIEKKENPYAFNFYKMDCTKWVKFFTLDLKDNSVVTIKCNAKDVEEVKQMVDRSRCIIESRIIVDMSSESSGEEFDAQSLSVDHLEAFRKFFVSTYGTSDTITKELEEVTK